METEKNRKMNRREFIESSTTLILAGIAVQFLGCKSGGSVTGPNYGSAPILQNFDGGAPAGVPQNTAKAAQALATADKIATVTNPTDIKHSAVVTSAQQDAGAALLLHIQGTETHDHTVNLTAQDLQDLKNGVQVAKTSSTTNLHSHTVTWAMVSAILPTIYGSQPASNG